jgi:hypothetical protein
MFFHDPSSILLEILDTRQIDKRTIKKAKSDSHSRENHRQGQGVPRPHLSVEIRHVDRQNVTSQAAIQQL